MAVSFNGKEVNKICFNNNVGYKIVGNPSIVDGVASGFSADNYVRTVKNFPTSNISTLEWGCKFTTGSNVNYQGITGTGSYWGCYGFRLNDYGALVIMLSYSPDIAIRFPTRTIKSNSTYIAKAYWNATTKEFSAKVSGDNGETWTTSSMVVSDDFSYRNVLVQFGKTQAGNFRGSIDLNETYIKVNGVTWFSGKEQASPTVNEVYLNRNVGYTVVGSPTIVDGVASGFSQSNYCYISNTVNNLQITECICKINIPSSALGQNTYYQIFFGVLSITTYSGASAFTQTTFYLQGIDNLFINHNLQPDTDYWIKYTNDGTNCTSWWSEDGINYTTGQSQPLSSMISQTTNTIIGLRGGAGQTNGDRVFPGSIYLNETYIKVNGVTWFNGKQTATTPVWTRSV